MMKNENGVTLVALVIMVIVIAILATVATYTGISTYREMQVTAFVKRVETVEEKVKSLKKRAEVDSVLSNELGLGSTTATYGDSLSSKYDNVSTVFSTLKISNSNDSDYRYFTNEKLESQLKLKDIEGDYIINFKTGDVYSVEGVMYKGNRVHSISEVRE
ncbi:MAG: hypothetical protein IKG42_00645 [Clostridia bacterium]|nr:hypothetical protein [Clostridia bacterium]